MMRHPTFFKYGLYLPVTWLAAPQLTQALRLLTASQHWPRERVEQLRVERLRRLIEHAQSRVPYYRQRLSADAARSFERAEDVRRLPFTTKEILKNHSSEFTDSKPRRFLTQKTTGGSTGQPLTIPKTREAMSWELAATWRGYSWAGVGIGDRQARLWGSSLDRQGRWRAALVDFACNRKRCSAFDFDDETLLRYHETLARFKPAYFYGYVSMLVQFAKFYQKRGLKPSYDLECIISTSEVLTLSHRTILESVFQTSVFDEYGCGELGTIAHECEHSNLHVSDENMILEILDGDEPCGPNVPGEMVITELNNYAAPLIRYRTGDFASWSEDACPCGRSLSVISNVFGRAYDLLYSADGRVFHAEFMMYIFEEAKRRDLGIGQFQVVQTALDAFHMRIVPEENYGPNTEHFITQQITNSFHADAKVTFERVDEIRRERSGKLRVIVGLGPQ
jgi:phenylacetate-CoA ligase